MDSDHYLTLSEPGHAQLRVLGSRFIGLAMALPDFAELESRLGPIRRDHFDATHHCFACRTGIGDRLSERAADAGEPRGTAGLPILREIRRRNLTHCLVVVTRYFGGTKLGTGNLARAYGDCASAALDASVIVKRPVLIEVRIRCKFEDRNLLYLAARRFGAIVRSQPADGSSQLYVLGVPPSQSPILEQWLRDQGQGRIVVSEA